MPLKLRAAGFAAVVAWMVSGASAQNIMNKPARLIAFSPANPSVVFTTVGTGLFRTTATQVDLLGLEYQSIFCGRPGWFSRKSRECCSTRAIHK
jgi:hypothetical protein